MSDPETPSSGEGWERLCHYVMGVLQGAVDPPNPDAPMREAWNEYFRLGGPSDPFADWPVTSLDPAAEGDPSPKVSEEGR